MLFFAIYASLTSFFSFFFPKAIAMAGLKNRAHRLATILLGLLSAQARTQTDPASPKMTWLYGCVLQNIGLPSCKSLDHFSIKTYSDDWGSPILKLSQLPGYFRVRRTLRSQPQVLDPPVGNSYELNMCLYIIYIYK